MYGWTEGDIDADGVRIHFHRTGHGEKPPLVLAHGFSDNGMCWSRVARVLQDEFDVVMVDARNHGGSSTGAADVSDQAADIAAVISDLGLDRPALMGHSVGATTMAELAGRHPGLVSRLVLEDPPWTVDRDQADDALDRRRDGVRDYIRSLADMTDLEIMDLGHQQHPDWPEEEFPAWVAAKRQLREQAADGLASVNWADLATRIECPTLLIHGDPDRGGMLTPDVAEQIEALNVRVSSCFVDEAGHNIRRENLARFIDVVNAFLRAG